MLSPAMTAPTPARSTPRSLQLPKDTRVRILLVLGLALVALVAKLAIAYNTVGTIDAILFFDFSRALQDHDVSWMYRNVILFNHPPLTAFFIRSINQLSEQPWARACGFTFPFLLRLPGILADFLVVCVLLWLTEIKHNLRVPAWALCLLAASPLSLMVSGFHGNVDGVMVLFLVLSTVAVTLNRPILAGLFFALSFQIKVAPLLLSPIFFFYWFSRRATLRFIVPVALVSLIFWAAPLWRDPLPFLHNVLSYSSYWGLWGISYLCRLTGMPAFQNVSFFGLHPLQNAIVTGLKALVIAAVCFLAWKRREEDEHGFIGSLAYAWMIFFAFSPGVAAQYTIWAAPFILLFVPVYYGLLTLASTAFVFVFYNTISHGLPWYVGISTNRLNPIWTPWTLLPWIVSVAGVIYFYRPIMRKEHVLREHRANH